MAPWTISSNSHDREVTIFHLIAKSCLVNPNESPEVFELEDAPGLAIDVSVGKKDGDLIFHRVRPPAFASNGSNGCFALRNTDIKYLTLVYERLNCSLFLRCDILGE